MVVAPQGIITGYQGAAGAHTQYTTNIPDKWQPTGGGRGGGEGGEAMAATHLRSLATRHSKQKYGKGQQIFVLTNNNSKKDSTNFLSEIFRSFIFD